MTDLFRNLSEDLKPLYEGFSGEVSAAFGRFDGADTYAYRADEPLPAASLIKLPVMLTVLERVAQGELRLDERLELASDAQVGGSGVLQHLRPGLTPTLHDLLTLMIIVSDNTATNMLIGRVGVEAVNLWCRQSGFYGTRLVGKLQLPEAERNEAQRRGERNLTCAADTLGLLMGLARGEGLPPAETGLALDILKRQVFTEALARHLPTNPELNAPHVEVASKSGCLAGVWHDAGIVFRDGRPLYALTVMTAGSADRRFHVEQEGVLLIAEVSRRVYKAVLGSEPT